MKWAEVTRDAPCLICGKPDWCTVSPDGGARRCMRVESDRPQPTGGWLHLDKTVTATNGTVRRWDIRDRTGVLVARHRRTDAPGREKDIKWEGPDGGAGLGGVRVEALPLYGAELLPDPPDGSIVVVTEGEPAADAVRRMGFLAVGTVTGAASAPGDAALRVLRGFDVVLWPDRDPPGDAHMARIGERLARLGASVRLLAWPDAPPKGDAADFEATGAPLGDLLDAARPRRGRLDLVPLKALLAETDGAADPSSSSSSLRKQNDDDDDDRIVTKLEASTASLGALRARYAAATTWIAEGYIALAELTMVVGAPESMKSWLMADLARAVHTGHLWLGSLQVPRGKVVYFEQERARNFVYQTGLIAAGWAQDLDGITTVEPCGIDICDPAWQRAITAVVSRERPVLVVFNSYRAIFRGRPPDSADVALALGWLGHLAERVPCAVVIVDATNKAGAVGQLRGMAAHGDSVQKAFEADTILHVERKRDKVGRGTGPARVYVGKQRYAAEDASPFVFDLVPSSSSRFFLGDDDDDDRSVEGVRALWLDQTTLEAEALTPAVKATVRVLRALPADGSARTVDDLAKTTGLSKGSLKNALTQLKENRQADNPERGRWCRAASSSSSSSISRDDDDDDQER